MPLGVLAAASDCGLGPPSYQRPGAWVRFAGFGEIRVVPPVLFFAELDLAMVTSPDSSE